MKPPVAVFGIGNRSRGDDAAGPLLVERLASRIGRQGRAHLLECFEEYQLQPENALDLVDRDLVLFIDARLGLEEPLAFEALVPGKGGFTALTHALSPRETLAIFRTITGQEPPPAFALGVWAESFELGATPSAGCLFAMERAWHLVQSLCGHPEPFRWRARSSTKFAREIIPLA